MNEEYIIDIEDIVSNDNSLRGAIEAMCKESEYTATGTIGSSFSTSGPGSGWSQTHGSSDFARRALSSSYGALYYLDADSGQLASSPDADDVEDDMTIEWTDESVINLRIPSFDEAKQYACAFAEMVRHLATHSDMSDMDGWAQLAEQISDERDIIEMMSEHVDEIKEACGVI